MNTNSDTEIKTKVEALLGRMSLAEKIGQLTEIAVADFYKGQDPKAEIRKGGVGAVMYVTNPQKINELQKIAVEESPSGIPILFALDVIHGFRTIFPIPLAMASSWDPATVERAQAVAAKEARAAGIHWTFSPMIDITRDARWGRIKEGAGEDPYLGSAIAAAHVRGYQGNTLGAADHLLACAKHFAGYGAADGGRDYDPVYLSEDQLRNIYLPPFKAALKAGVATFMSAYMDLNNVPATANRFLLKEVLRDEWDFQGFVVSDASAVGNLVAQGFAKDGRDAAFRAFDAGLNMDMSSRTYAQQLAGLVEAGKLTLAEIDAAVHPILEIKFRMGLFEHPYAEEGLPGEISSLPEHRQEARWTAQRSMVLLKNEGGLLPLSRNLKNLAVIGPLADAKDVMGGNGVPFGDFKTTAVSVIEGIRAKLPNANVVYAPGPGIRRDILPFFVDMVPDMFPEFKKPAQTPVEAEESFQEALATARQADLVVMVLGEDDSMAGEYASRASFDLPGRQEELLKAVVALGKPVVLVLLNGRPLSIGWAAENVPAILEAWEPGNEGGNAIADILVGDANPGGKLPVTFPRKASHAPMYYARNLTHMSESSPMYRSRYWDGPVTPLFPFGFGLSYSTFTFTNLKVSAEQVKVGQTIEVHVDVTNTSPIAGDEVAQLYIHQRAGSDSRPVRELKGFERITLQPGEIRTVTFKLGPDELTYWSASAGEWVQDATTFDVWVGNDSQAALHAEFSVID
jgi:beta-glucosidase